MKCVDAQALQTTLAHSEIPRKAFVKVGDMKSAVQTVNDAWLEEGQSYDQHAHSDCEEVFYILEGEGVAYIDDEEIKFRPGIVIIVSPGELHGVSNIGIGRLRYISIRVKVGE